MLMLKQLKKLQLEKQFNKFGLTEKEIIKIINKYKKSKYININV